MAGWVRVTRTIEDVTITELQPAPLLTQNANGNNITITTEYETDSSNNPRQRIKRWYNSRGVEYKTERCLSVDLNGNPRPNSQCQITSTQYNASGELVAGSSVSSEIQYNSFGIRNTERILYKNGNSMERVSSDIQYIAGIRNTEHIVYTNGNSMEMELSDAQYDDLGRVSSWVIGYNNGNCRQDTWCYENNTDVTGTITTTETAGSDMNGKKCTATPPQYKDFLNPLPITGEFIEKTERKEKAEEKKYRARENSCSSYKS